jgi:hypothetical protein
MAGERGLEAVNAGGDPPDSGGGDTFVGWFSLITAGEVMTGSGVPEGSCARAQALKLMKNARKIVNRRARVHI